jgi:serine/threonine protein phosphatase PrpC
MSLNSGRNYVRLSRDHKPDDLDERKRIESNGGKVYQN